MDEATHVGERLDALEDKFVEALEQLAQIETLMERLEEREKGSEETP